MAGIMTAVLSVALNFFPVAGSEQTHSTLQFSSWVEGRNKGDGGQERWRNVCRMG